MSYTAKSVLIIIAVAVASFFVAQIVLPNKHAVSEKDMQPKQAQASLSAKPKAADADVPVVSVETPPAAAPSVSPGDRRESAKRDAAGAHDALKTATPVPEPAPAPIAQVAAASAPPAPPAPDTAARPRRTTAGSPLKVQQAAVCTEVVSRAPVGAGAKFSKETPQIFYFTHIIGARDTAQIAHRWYRDGKLVQTSRREIKSPSWRTHTRRVVDKAADVGSWRVEVVDTKAGVVLESATFVIE